MKARQTLRKTLLPGLLLGALLLAGAGVPAAQAAGVWAVSASGGSGPSQDGGEETETPTPEPTEEPTETTTPEPTDEPTDEPTETTTPEPTDEPTEEPTETATPEPTEEPTEEPALAASASAAQTNSVVFHIADWSTSPGTLNAGSEFDLAMTLENVGSTDSTDVLVTIGSSSTFVNVGSAASLGDVASGGSTSTTLRVGISPDAASGFYNIPVQFAYEDLASGERETDTQNIGVTVVGTSSDDEEEEEELEYAAFVVEDWSAPALQSGSEFDLYVKIRNVGEGDAESVSVTVGSSSTFVNVGGAAELGDIDDEDAEDFTLRVGVTSGLSSGYYNIPLEISYTNEDAPDTRQSETQSIGVYVEGLPTDVGSSTFSVDSWTIQPETLYAGYQFTLNLTLTNIGEATADEVLISIGSDSSFVGTGAAQRLGSIASGASAAASLQVGVGSSVSEGYHTIPIEIGFDNVTESGTDRLTETRTVGIYIYGSGSSSNVDDFLLSNYEATPQTLTPGASFELQLTFVNTSDSRINDFFVRLGESTEIAPLGGSAVFYREELEAGESVTVIYDLLVDGGAQTGIVSLPISLEYEDIYDMVKEQTETVSLAIQEEAHLQIDLFDIVPDEILVGDTFEIPVEAINIGASSINTNTIELVSDDLALTDATEYIGPLDSGSSGTMIASAEALQAGTASVEVRVHYLDDYQQPQTAIETLTFEVQETPATPEPTQTPDQSTEPTSFWGSLWQALLGFLGLRTEQSGGSFPSGGEFPQGEVPAE
jgi:hypothetical protein